MQGFVVASCPRYKSRQQSRRIWSSNGFCKVVQRKKGLLAICSIDAREKEVSSTADEERSRKNAPGKFILIRLSSPNDRRFLPFSSSPMRFSGNWGNGAKRERDLSLLKALFFHRSSLHFLPLSLWFHLPENFFPLGITCWWAPHLTNSALNNESILIQLSHNQNIYSWSSSQHVYYDFYIYVDL